MMHRRITTYIVAVLICFSVTPTIPALAQTECANVDTSLRFWSEFLPAATLGTQVNRAQTDGLEAAVKSTICQPVPRIQIPGLNFTNINTILQNAQTTTDGDIYLQIPFLGEYITAIYRYAVGIVSIIAILVIIVSGVQWTVSGGDQTTISNAKERILNALVGMALALGSYVILYTINPELVEFRSLHVTYVGTSQVVTTDGSSYIPPSDTQYQPASQVDIDSGSTRPAGPLPSGFPRSLCNSIDKCQPICNDKESWPSIPPTDGMSGLEDTVLLQDAIDAAGMSSAFVISSGVRLHKELVPQLIEAAQAFQHQGGLQLGITSGWRPLLKQLELACPKILNGTFDSRLIAWPGGSVHGSGRAVDIHLRRGGKQISGTNKREQNAQKYRDGNRILANTMFTLGWQRLIYEVWHFEYPASSPLPRTRTAGEREDCFETSC